MKRILLCFEVLIFISSLMGCTRVEDGKNRILITPSASFDPTSLFTSTPDEFLPSSSPLSFEFAQEKYLKLLSTNDECKLPCFWGITPGISTTQDAADTFNLLTSISKVSSPSSSRGTFDFNYYDGEYNLSTSVYYSSSNSDSDIIDKISVLITESKDYNSIFGVSINSKPYAEFVYPYTISGILSELGKPEVIQISTAGSNFDQYWQFIIVLIYPDKGILLQYVTPLKTNGEMIVGCPANAHIEISLHPAANSDRFSEWISTTIWAELWPPSATPQPGWLPIDKATSMTIDQFYETFRDDPEACISTPAELWK